MEGGSHTHGPANDLLGEVLSILAPVLPGPPGYVADDRVASLSQCRDLALGRVESVNRYLLEKYHDVEVVSRETVKMRFGRDLKRAYVSAQ